MTRQILFVLVLAAQALLCGAPVFAQSSSKTSLEAQLALESSLEKRVQMVLSEALGTDDVIVIISAELQQQNKKAPELLPGVPQEGRMGEPSLSSSLTMVKSISAQLILDKAMPDADVNLAKKLTAGLLGLPPDREDLVSVERMDFRRAKPMTAYDLLAPANFWSLAWIIVVVLLALFTISVFLAPASRSLRTFAESAAARTAAQEAAPAVRREAAREPEPNEPATGQAQQTAPPRAPAEDGPKPPFWFLSPSHLSSLAFIMKEHPVEDITILLSYSPPELAGKLAEALYPRSAEALAALPRVTLMPEARVRALETEIRNALDFVVGGEDKTVEILSGLDESVQEKALAAFSRLNPAMARKIRASVVRLANVLDLEPAHAQALARRLPMRLLAAALKGSPYASSFAAKLTGGMQERLKQELDLTRDLPPEAYKGDRAKVVEAMRQMLKEGLIALRPQAAAPHAPRPAGAPPAAQRQPVPAAVGAAPAQAAAIPPASRPEQPAPKP